MKKILILTIAAFAMSSAVFAQTTAKDSIQAAKQAAKAKKAQDAADLKAFKEQQKADLIAFMEAQKNGKPATPAIKVEKPTLVTPNDSLSYLLGIARSNGLEQYVQQQLGVSQEQYPKFVEGVLSRAKTDPNDKGAAAFSAGTMVGDQIIQMGKQFSNQYYTAEEHMQIDQVFMAEGIVAGFLGQGEISVDSASQVIRALETARQNANNEKNRLAGERFLEENKTKEGVQVTASGLQYKVITMGTGEKPTANQKVKVDYEGKLIDGTVFDSSYQRGQPATFQVNQVIAGWTEALQLMPVGSKWEIYIPYQLAYGERNAGAQIKPYSTLIFTVDLKSIEK